MHKYGSVKQKQARTNNILYVTYFIWHVLIDILTQLSISIWFSYSKVDFDLTLF